MAMKINIILLLIVFTSCNQINSSVDSSNINHIMIEKYVQSDSTIISDDYPILKKDSYEYIFNSKKELIAVYNNDSDIYILFYLVLISIVNIN